MALARILARGDNQRPIASDTAQHRGLSARQDFGAELLRRWRRPLGNWAQGLQFVMNS